MPRRLRLCTARRTPRHQDEQADVFIIDPGPVVSVSLTSDGARFLAVFVRAIASSTADMLGNFVAVE